MVLSVFLLHPFVGFRVAEYRFRLVYREGVHPVVAVLDEYGLDGEGVWFVPDTASVWPEAGLFPRVYSYDELLEGLRSVVARKCVGLFGSSVCGRLRVAVFPWFGLFGGWRFTGWFEDAVVFMAYHLAELVKQEGEVNVVVQDGVNSLEVLALVEAIRALGGRARLLYAARHPVPWEKRRPPVLEVLEYKLRGGGDEVNVRLVERVPGPGVRVLRMVCRLDDVECLGRLVDWYVEGTVLKKEKVGGVVVHRVGFQLS